MTKISAKCQAELEEQGLIDDQLGPTHKWRRWAIRWAPRSLGLFILLLLAFVGVDYVAAIQSLRHVRIDFLIPGLIIFFLGALGSLATWMLTASFLRLGYKRQISYVRIYLVGLFAGLGVPQGAATLARLAVVAADKRSVPRGLVAIGVERVIQTTVIVAFLLVSSVYLAALTLEALKWLIMGVGVLIAGALLLVLASRMRLTASLGRRLGSHRRIRTFVEEFKTGVREARQIPPVRLAVIWATAMVAASLTVTALFLASRALDLHISFVVMMAAWATVGLTNLLPISINGLGPREGILTAAVAGVGLNSEGGVALGLLWFFMQAATRLVAGLAYFTVLRVNREPIQIEASGTGLE